MRRTYKGLAWHPGVLHGLRPVVGSFPPPVGSAALCGSCCPALEPSWTEGLRIGGWASLLGDRWAEDFLLPVLPVYLTWLPFRCLESEDRKDQRPADRPPDGSFCLTLL